MKWFNLANAILFVALASGAAHAQWYEAAATDETNPLAAPTLAPAAATDGGSYGPGTPPMPADAGHASPSPSDLGPIRLPGAGAAGAPPAATVEPAHAAGSNPALGAPTIAPPVGAPPVEGEVIPPPAPAAVMPGIAPLAAPAVTPAPAEGFINNATASAGPIVNDVNSQYHKIPFGDQCPTSPNPCNAGLWNSYCADKKYWCQRQPCASRVRKSCPAPTSCGAYAPRGPKPCTCGCGSPCGDACAAPVASPCGAACGSSLFSGFKLPKLSFAGCNPWTRGGCGAPACAAPAPCAPVCSAPVCGPAPCAPACGPAPCAGGCGFRGKYGNTSCGPCGGCGNACGAGCAGGCGFSGLSLFKGLGFGAGCGAKQSCNAHSGCCDKSLNTYSGWLGIGFGRPGYHYADHAPVQCGGCCDGGYDHHAAQLDLHNGPGVYRGGTAGYDQGPGSHVMPTTLPPATAAPKHAPQPVPAPVSKGARRPFFNLNRGF